MTADFLYILNGMTNHEIEQETDRLDLQHHLIDEMMNNEILPPHIASQLAATPSPKLCDIATGSAM